MGRRGRMGRAGRVGLLGEFLMQVVGFCLRNTVICPDVKRFIS